MHTLPDGAYELRMKFQGPDAHAQDEAQLYGTLTWRQRQVAKRSQGRDIGEIEEAVPALKDAANPGMPSPPLKRGVLSGLFAPCPAENPCVKPRNARESQQGAQLQRF